MGKEIFFFIFTTGKRSVSVRAFEKRERKIEKSAERIRRLLDLGGWAQRKILSFQKDGYKIAALCGTNGKNLKSRGQGCDQRKKRLF